MQAVTSLENKTSLDRRWWTVPLTAFVVTRLVIVAATLLVAISSTMGKDAATVSDFIGQTATHFVQAWTRWDAERYAHIATYGYMYPAPERMIVSNVAWLPLYPLTMRLLMPFTGGDALLAGLIISNVCFLITLVLLYRLTYEKFSDEQLANRTVFYFAAFPFALFFFAPYAESLFLLLSLIVFYACSKQQWLVAAVAAGFSSALRYPGLLLGGVIVLEWLAAHGWTLSRLHRFETWQHLWRVLKADGLGLIPILVITPLGFLLHMLYLQLAFGDAFLYGKQQIHWRGPYIPNLVEMNKFPPLFEYFWQTREIYLAPNISGAIIFFVCLPMAILIWRRIGKSEALYALLSMIIPALHHFFSMGRYLMAIFPLFMLLALDRKNRGGEMLLRGFFLLLLFLFTLGHLLKLFIG